MIVKPKKTRSAKLELGDAKALLHPL